MECDAKAAKQLLNRLTDAGNILAGVFYTDGAREDYMIAKRGNSRFPAGKWQRSPTDYLMGKAAEAIPSLRAAVS